MVIEIQYPPDTLVWGILYFVTPAIIFRHVVHMYKYV